LLEPDLHIQVMDQRTRETFTLPASQIAFGGIEDAYRVGDRVACRIPPDFRESKLGVVASNDVVPIDKILVSFELGKPHPIPLRFVALWTRTEHLFSAGRPDVVVRVVNDIEGALEEAKKMARLHGASFASTRSSVGVSDLFPVVSAEFHEHVRSSFKLSKERVDVLVDVAARILVGCSFMAVSSCYCGRMQATV